MIRTVARAASLAGLVALAAAGALAATPPEAPATSPNTFVEQAIRGDIGAVELGKLAAARGSSIGVQNFGQTLETDASLAAAEAAKVADRLGVLPPGHSYPSPATAADYARLAKLHGPAFDRAFVRTMIAEDSRNVRAFQAEATANAGPASDLAGKELPTLRQHLQTAELLQREAHEHAAE